MELGRGFFHSVTPPLVRSKGHQVANRYEVALSWFMWGVSDAAKSLMG